MSSPRADPHNLAFKPVRLMTSLRWLMVLTMCGVTRMPRVTGQTETDSKLRIYLMSKNVINKKITHCGTYRSGQPGHEVQCDIG